MTTSSLYKEIESLNKDIDKCKGRVDNIASKRNPCPPNCYCDKRSVMDRKNANCISATRRKTATAKVTKMDITPSCYQEREVSNTAVNMKPQTVGDEIYTRNNSCERLQCQNSKKNHAHTSMRYPRETNSHLYSDNTIEPVKLPKKCSHVRNEPSWSAILQQNNVDNMKENIYCQAVPTKDCYTQMKSSSNSSAASFVPQEAQTVYMKNRGVQCSEISLPSDKPSEYSEPLNTIQYIIMNMKSKLKDDPSLGSMLDEMEVVLRRIPLDRGDIYGVGNFAKESGNGNYRKYLHPKPNFSKPKLHTTYGDVLNLEATYQELEATCTKLKMERNAAIEKASQKSAELVESMRREVETKAKLNETNSKIKDMSAKLETYTRSMEGLTEHVKRLQNENRDMERIRGQVAQLSSMMRDVTQENKSLLAELQLITIERNKLEVALAVKEQDLLKKSKELESMAQLLSEKSKITDVEIQEIERPQTPEPLELYDLQRSYRNETRNSPQLVSSSPNSSSSESLLRERLKSWVALSTISTADGRSEIDYPILSMTNKKQNKRTNTVKIAETSNCSVQTSAQVQTVSQQEPPVNNEKRPDLSKIEKLKEEIRHMFSEMRELAQDVPSIPVVEFSSIGDSSDINWSEVSNTINSCESISDFNQSDFNDILDRYKS